MKRLMRNRGSARVSRAGNGVAPLRTFVESTQAKIKSLLRRDTATSTRDARATQTLLTTLIL